MRSAPSGRTAPRSPFSTSSGSPRPASASHVPPPPHAGCGGRLRERTALASSASRSSAASSRGRRRAHPVTAACASRSARAHRSPAVLALAPALSCAEVPRARSRRARDLVRGARTLSSDSLALLRRSLGARSSYRSAALCLRPNPALQQCSRARRWRAGERDRRVPRRGDLPSRPWSSPACRALSPLCCSQVAMPVTRARHSVVALRLEQLARLESATASCPGPPLPAPRYARSAQLVDIPLLIARAGSRLAAVV